MAMAPSTSALTLDRRGEHESWRLPQSPGLTKNTEIWISQIW